MSTIPLPALGLKTPEQPDVLGQLGKLSQLKSMQQNQQIQQQEIQQKGMELRDQQAMNAAMQQWDGKDLHDLPGLLIHNKASAKAVLGMKSTILQQDKTLSEKAKDDAETGSKNMETMIQKNDQMAGRVSSLLALPDEQIAGAIAPTAEQSVKDGLLDPQHAQAAEQLAQLPADQIRQHLSALQKSYMGATAQQKKAMDDADLAAKKAQLPGQQAESALKTQQLQIAQSGGAVPGVGLDVQEANSWLRKNPGKTLAEYPAAKAADEATATEPVKLHQARAEAEMKQAVADGDPRAAAKLLIDGTVAPSQLISSRKPAFAQQAFTAAAQMQPGWSATKADADYKVASSPAQVAFFGSAKSLTDKGGTLDQLAAAAKDIPSNQIPVFNTVADAIKASTGSGPIAKYASLALGVADDYSKVMGGWQGSDTSRTQALNLIAAKQSLEQRAAAIEGIRGAVNSQAKSRIGNNAVLDKMYGDEPATSPKSGNYADQFPEHK